ncbi:hypothetical protein [Pseudogemmobacter faecipullorum]|uniref:Uncharacterized protein n=1 Tax=Pseudogemmobacter faecipullorum TaxID=2755041 RepID=A0ABS8CGY3_9RHOB|nr:hypothetical protein [Pseudogemmobacter faecipullorum]MCB5408623.1 hypothetical protein [Pseudogemmobacter faecipullorum]
MARPPTGALIALAAAALPALVMKADPKGAGQDPAVRGPAKIIGAGGLLWLALATLKRLIRRSRL